jgi:hypothetical protein
MGVVAVADDPVLGVPQHHVGQDRACGEATDRRQGPNAGKATSGHNKGVWRPRFNMAATFLRHEIAGEKSGINRRAAPPHCSPELKPH